MDTIVSLVTGLVGGIGVVIVSNLLSREKTRAEVAKLFQETEYLKAQTSRITGDVSEVKATQGQQGSDLQALAALFVISDWQRNHLRKLASPDPFPYEKLHSFETELRHLRMLGLIENIPGKTVSEMPDNGDLKQHFRITDKGTEYLTLVNQLTSSRS